MKTNIFTLTLLTLATLTFVSNSFAQDDSLEYVVRVIYFLPNDRESQPNIDTKLDSMMKETQQFFADVMETNGFGRKTFQLETDENGTVMVHHVNAKSNDTFYHSQLLRKVIDELSPNFDTSKNIYYVAIDVSSENSFDLPNSHICGVATGNWAFTAASGACFNYKVIAHELGHNFGLSHNRINYTGIDAMLESFWSAEWLDVHPFFNERKQTDFNEPTTVNMLTPSRAPSSNAVRFSFEVRDTDGLHQAQLYIPTLNSVVASKRLSSENTTVEFDTTRVVSELNSISLKVIDVNGNHTDHYYQVDISEFLLPPKKITIPDTTLAAAVRKYTRLPPNADITTDTMVRLTRLWNILPASDAPITDITGLEHATNLVALSFFHQNKITDFSFLSGLRELKYLELSGTGISDISVLSALTKLKTLYLWDNAIQDVSALKELTDLTRLEMQNNQISDVTPLAELTNLKTMRLDNNAIHDVSALAGFTNLKSLELWNNQISDVTPLAGLTNLTYLDLHGNRISDITPITGLTNLEYLDLNSNQQISDITPITGLTNLKYLRFGGTQISDITPITGLTNLETLQLPSNVSNISVVARLPKLQELWLFWSQVSDITALTELTNLRILKLAGNQISDVSPLSELVNLEELHLWENPIKDRKPLLELLRKNPGVKIYLKDNRTPLPINLSHFRAERTEAGVVLKWTTESEVDNAGFYIYRSETRDGEFKVVNPTMIQGAGTTGKRNQYTWTDATAKPNTVYYYRIEDVSHAGVREQLATVRLKGLISAHGKLTTSWADLKAKN